METTLSQENNPLIALDERIAAVHGDLSAKQKRLARFILDNKYFVSFASAHETADKTGTSAATVVRFAQTLGYEGFSEMQAAIRTELPTYFTAVERIQARLKTPQVSDDVPHQVFRTDISNIERTAENFSAEILDEAVEMIVAANHILVVGTGLSAAPAVFLAHSLKIIGMDARLNINEGLSLAVDTSQLQPGDLMIAIDVWRYVRSTVSAMTYSKREDIGVIAITDSLVSPLSKIADYTFEVVTNGVAHSLSSTAVMSVLNVLIAALSYRVPEQTMQSLRRIDNSYRENQLLIME